MGGTFSGISEFVVRLMSGGTFEIVLLIVLIVVALILFLVALWIFIKLVILLGKGLLWVFRVGGETAKEKAAARREAQLAAPPQIATNWDASPKIGLRRALKQARRLAGPDALNVVLLAGEGASDLCRGLDLNPPGVGVLGIAADTDIVVIDATQSNASGMRRLATSLPWRRPADAVAVLVGPEGIPSETLARAADFARITGMRVALHFVLPSSGLVAARRIIDSQNRDGAKLCTELADDSVRVWLDGGSREGLKELALAQSRELPSSIDRALAASPGSVDIASLCFGGAGLRSAISQTLDRSSPSTVPGASMWAAAAVFVVGISLTLLAGVSATEQSIALRNTVDTAKREAAVPWATEGIETVPSAARVRRFSGLSSKLAEFSSFSFLLPLAPLVPSFYAARELGAAFQLAYVLRPLATALDRESRERLLPDDDPLTWINNARVVDEWLAAWEALGENPREVDMRRLFVDAFGGDRSSWAEGTDIALIETGVKPPPAEAGGLDVDVLTNLARDNFILTMQQWAHKVYTNGPVATAARRVIDRSTNWRDQHAALVDLRNALQDPTQQWLTANKDRPDTAFEVRALGRALGLSVLGETNALEAKADVAKIRIDAREAPEFMIRPEIGPLMVRSGGGSGPSLSMSRPAEAWLTFLDRVNSAGFADLPKEPPFYLGGPVTVDVGAVAEIRRKLQVFDRFATNLPQDLPPGVAQNLIREIASELVLGVVVGVELTTQPDNPAGSPSERVARLARTAPALGDLTEIDAWLREREAREEADRVQVVLGRVAENVLSASTDLLNNEDPLGIFPDPAADRAALSRHFERGLGRLQRIHEQYAQPFVEGAKAHGGRAAVEWEAMARDLEGFARGDATSSISGMEGMVQAYVDNPDEACAAPRAPLAGTRDDYIARALSRFRKSVDKACQDREMADTMEVYSEISRFFKREVAWLWPFARDANAPEVPVSTMHEFVRLLTEGKEDIGDINEALAGILTEFTGFWTYSEDMEATVRFRIEWRARPSEESLAENVIAYKIEGPQIDEDGIHIWRYGAPLSIEFRLAKNSPYRFAVGGGSGGLTYTTKSEGNGQLLRVFAGLAGGALNFELPLLDAEGERQLLRVTARVSHPDGAPVTVPNFSYPQEAFRTGSVSRGG